MRTHIQSSGIYVELADVTFKWCKKLSGSEFWECRTYFPVTNLLQVSDLSGSLVYFAMKCGE